MNEIHMMTQMHCMILLGFDPSSRDGFALITEAFYSGLQRMEEGKKDEFSHVKHVYADTWKALCVKTFDVEPLELNEMKAKKFSHSFAQEIISKGGDLKKLASKTTDIQSIEFADAMMREITIPSFKAVAEIEKYAHESTSEFAALYAGFNAHQYDQHIVATVSQAFQELQRQMM